MEVEEKNWEKAKRGSISPLERKRHAATLLRKGLTETVAPVYHQGLRRLTTPTSRFR